MSANHVTIPSRVSETFVCPASHICLGATRNGRKFTTTTSGSVLRCILRYLEGRVVERVELICRRYCPCLAGGRAESGDITAVEH